MCVCVCVCVYASVCVCVCFCVCVYILVDKEHVTTYLLQVPRTVTNRESILSAHLSAFVCVYRVQTVCVYRVSKPTIDVSCRSLSANEPLIIFAGKVLQKGAIP